MSAVLLFLATGAVLIVAGTVLARAGEEISQATGLGRVWIGAVLIAVWSVLTGLVGVGERVPVLEPAVAVGV